MIRSWLPNLTNDPREREKVSVIPRFFASLAGFTVSTAGLYVINYFNRIAGEENAFAETGYTLFAVVIAKAEIQSTATIQGIRVLMLVLPIIMAVISYWIYQRCYKLKGKKMQEVTRKLNEMHAQKQTGTV